MVIGKKNVSRMAKRWLLFIAFLVYFSGIVGNSLQAYEYSGMTLDMMSSNSTNFYGFGFFTSDKRFTAGISLLVPSAVYASLFNSSEQSQDPDTKMWNRDYPFYSLLFYANYNFIRTSRTAYFVSYAMMPLIPTKYVYALGGGVEFFQSEGVRFVFSYNNIFTNYVSNDEGKSSHLNRIANGAAFSFGVKFAFTGKKVVRSDIKPVQPTQPVKMREPEPRRKSGTWSNN